MIKWNEQTYYNMFYARCVFFSFLSYFFCSFFSVFTCTFLPLRYLALTAPSFFLFFFLTPVTRRFGCFHFAHTTVKLINKVHRSTFSSLSLFPFQLPFFRFLVLLALLLSCVCVCWRSKALVWFSVVENNNQILLVLSSCSLSWFFIFLSRNKVWC